MLIDVPRRVASHETCWGKGAVCHTAKLLAQGGHNLRVARRYA